ncbi:MAG: ComEC/Rec2 family competence protein, partial [Rickettsiales bacterium]
LNLYTKISDKFDVKKISSIIAIFGSLFYLLISGMQIAALRSFLMTTIIMIAIIIDRLPTPIRSVMFAFFIILIIYPESIFDPSFQMSFSAVIALISCYEFSLMNIKNNSNILPRLFNYIYSTLFSSIIASIATAPFAAYHFNQFSGYGFITNLIAIPVTSFLIMPQVIIAFLLYPFNMHVIPLKIMGIGIDILIKISSIIASMPMSAFKIPSISSSCIIIVTLSGLWFTLWRYKLRYFSILILGISIFIYILTPRASIIASIKGYSYLDNDNNLVFANNKIRGFTKESWLNYYGQEVPIYYKYDNYYYNCNNNLCNYNIKNYNIVLVGKKLIENQCKNYDLIVDYSDNDFLSKCPNSKYLKINKDIYHIYLNDKILVNNLEESIGNRRWNIFR